MNRPAATTAKALTQENQADDLEKSGDAAGAKKARRSRGQDPGTRAQGEPKEPAKPMPTTPAKMHDDLIEA